MLLETITVYYESTKYQFGFCHYRLPVDVSFEEERERLLDAGLCVTTRRYSGNACTEAVIDAEMIAPGNIREIIKHDPPEWYTTGAINRVTRKE